MRGKVAVVTVSGKAYFLLVNELKEKNIEFISMIPGEALPAEVKVVLTTQKEKPLITHERILAYNTETSPNTIINEAAKIAQGKETNEKMVIGIDPGEVFGVAVMVDGKTADTYNCFSIHELLKQIKNIIENVNLESTKVTIKIGNGVPVYREVLDILDAGLPRQVILEVVNEAGTSHPLIAHRRGLRDITSAIRIAGRTGFAQDREGSGEENTIL
jgi:hypothetical protein